MDVNEYIASGILESYSIGAVSPQEKQEVECMAHIYPEIRAELDKIMLSLEDLAITQKMSPPPGLKEKIFSEIRKHDGQSSGPKILPIKASNNFQSFNRLLAAACVVMAFSMVALYFYQTSNAVDLSKKLKFANETISQHEFTIAKLEEKKKYSDGEIAMFRNPDFKTVFLKSTNNKPKDALAIVCCNPKNKQTVIAIESLPQPPVQMQYQLWAMVDGKPVDMGMIPSDSLAQGFFAVKNIDNAQAFAITLEKAGGNSKPTMEEMIVFGVN